MDIFVNYEWPGNVRQLRNCIERAVVLARTDRITANELPVEFSARARTTAAKPETVKPLKMLERQAINDALALCNGNKSQAAKKLGISRKTFYKKLNEG
jgi:DNA-binding NtrC family response regulator